MDFGGKPETEKIQGFEPEACVLEKPCQGWLQGEGDWTRFLLVVFPGTAFPSKQCNPQHIYFLKKAALKYLHCITLQLLCSSMYVSLMCTSAPNWRRLEEVSEGSSSPCQCFPLLYRNPPSDDQCSVARYYIFFHRSNNVRSNRSNNMLHSNIASKDSCFSQFIFMNVCNLDFCSSCKESGHCFPS